MKKQECTVIFNTRNGYCLQPVKCASIRQALLLARENKLAFRLFINGVCVRKGWFM